MSDINKQEIAEVSGGQVAQNVEGDQIYIENPIYNNTYTTYKPLEIDNGLEINIKEQKSSHQDKKALKIGFMISAIILSLLTSSNFIDIFFNGIFSFLIFTMLFYFSFHFFLLIPTIVSTRGTLKLEKEKMIFKFGKREVESIQFDNIRSIRKEKNFFGYSFYLYEKKEFYPTVSFYVESIDISLAIDELIQHKINESINKFEREQKIEK